MNIKSNLLAVIVLLVSTNANSALVTVSFDSLEVADSDRHQLTSYTEGGLTFTGPEPPIIESATGVWYGGQTGDVYQGSAGLFVKQNNGTMVIEAQPGETFNLVSMGLADLCGGGIFNGLCNHTPGEDIYFGVRTFNEDTSEIAIDNSLMSPGFVGGFNTFSFSGELGTILNGFGVYRMEIYSTSSLVEKIQIDNFTFETTVVPIPAAVWLFGSGLIGIIGAAKRRKA